MKRIFLLLLMLPFFAAAQSPVGKYGNAGALPFLTPEMFGARGTGAADDAAALNSAFLAGQNEKKDVVLNGQYLIKGQVYLQNCTVRQNPGSKIIIAPDFTFTEVIAGRATSCILNKNFSGSVNAFSDVITLDGLNVECRMLNGANISIIGLANVKQGNIHNCTINVNDGINSSATALDLWACDKNIVIDRCTINNKMQSTAGGSIWVRNITSDGSLEANNTEHITIRNCIITHAGKDEPLAIYGVHGLTRNVLVDNVNITALPSSKIHSVLVSCFPLNDGSAGGVHAAVENVTFRNCTFTDAYFSAHMLRIGRTGSDSARICNNITVDHCRFNASKTVPCTSYVLRNIKCRGDNIRAVNNILFADNSVQPVTNGISGFDVVSGNIITGKYTNAISSCMQVSNNDITNTAGGGIVNCASVQGNRVKSKDH